MFGKMSKLARLKLIEDLDVNQLAEALEMNGYGSCVGVIRAKHIDGQAFLKLTELQLSLWRLLTVDARRLWSFIQQVKQDPSQFLLKNDKPVPKVKPPITERTMYGNLPVRSNFSTNKPNVVSKPCRFQKFNETTKENSLTIIKQETKLLESNKIEKFEETKRITLATQESRNKETNSSTLTKDESKLLKSNLESLFNKQTTNTSCTPNQQAFLPPKPDRLKISGPDKYEESPVDYVGYLEPIIPVKEPQVPERVRTSTFSRNDSNRNSFLHRQRRINYDNLEIRPEVIQNDYQEQNIKQKIIVQSRPLPPVPIEARMPVPAPPLEIDNEELAEYAAVPEEEEQPKVKGRNHRPLPPVPLDQDRKIIQRLSELNQFKNSTEDEEELAEYTPVIEEDEPKNNLLERINKSHSPLPPLRIPVPAPPKSRLRERVKLPTPESDDIKEDVISHQLQQMSLLRPKPDKVKLSITTSATTLPRQPSQILKPDASSFIATLPKPPINLPNPPIGLLPSSSDFLNNSQHEDFNFSASCKHEDKRIPPPLLEIQTPSTSQDMDEMDEQPFYTDIDLAREPCYRETDRKGARRLLTGLDNGAFAIRPSRQPQYICTISIMHSNRMFNLGVERNSEGVFTFGSVAPNFDQPKFYSVSEIIAYYSMHPLYLSGENILLKDILPRNKH